MNALDIILEGYLNPKTRDDLQSYFIEKFRETQQKDLHEADKFFISCLNILKSLESKAAENFIAEKYILKDLIKESRKRTISLCEKWLEETGQSYEQGCESFILSCKKELKTLKKEDFPIDLHSFTKGKFTGSLNLNNLQIIKEDLNKAYGSISSTLE